MSITSQAIWAASPSTTRGQPTPLSTDPKGERIAYAANKSIILRSIDKPEVSKQYTAHTTQTTVAKFSPSGFYVASGDVSGSVRIWDAVEAENTKGEYHIIAGRINDIAWDGDSQRVIAVGDGKERFGHCITADSGNSVGEISGQSAAINCVAIKPQRPYRAATGSDDTTLAFYNGPPFKFTTSLRGHHTKFVYGTAFSPSGSTLVSVGADRKIWLYDGKTGEPRGQIGEGVHTGSIFGVSWAPDSSAFATASADQTVRIWDVERGIATQTWRLGGDDDAVISVPDQQVGVVWPAARTDGLIISVDLDGNLNYLNRGTSGSKPSRIVHGHQRAITAAALSPPNATPSTLWTGSYDGRVRAWDLNSGTASALDGSGPSTSVAGFAVPSSSSTAANAAGARIYSAAWDDTLRGIDTAQHTFTGATSPTSGQPAALAATPSHVLVATPTAIDVFAAASGARVSSLPTSGHTVGALAAHGPVVVSGAEDGSLRVHMLTGDELKLTQTVPPAKSSAVSVLAFSGEGKYLAAGTAGGHIVVYETGTWGVETSRWSAHTGRVAAVAWRPGSEGVAVSGGLDTNVFVWSLKTPGRRVKAGNAHKDGVSGIGWVDRGTVVSTGKDAVVRVWKVESVE